MKKVVKISEKKLINFIKKSLNEYNNKMINKTNNVLNEQDNNGWKIVPTEEFFNNLKNTGKYEFRPDKFTTVLNKSITYSKKKSEENKKSEEKVELTPEEKKEQSKQKDIEEAWQEVQLYGLDYGLYMEAELDSNGDKTNYYDINGIKYYNDGFKVIGKKKVRYFKEDPNFRNPPNIKIVWRDTYPCVPNYAIENQKGDYDKNTNFWKIENVIYKPTGKKSLDNGKSWVDFDCSDSELKNYIKRK